jgi:hypothetical protein
LALLIVGIALLAFGALVLLRYPTRPGGKVAWRGFEVSSAGAGLPILALGVAAIVVSQVDPFDWKGDEDVTVGAGESNAPAYFGAVEGARGRVRFENGAMYFEASEQARPLINLARGVNTDDVRFRVRATHVDGAADHGIGLICRHEFSGRYYLLAIRPPSSETRGGFNFLKYDGGRARWLLGRWQQSGSVDRRVNTLEARCEGDDPVRLTLLVNGTRVGPPVEDADGITRGAIGLRVGTADPPVTVRFDDFELVE